MKKYLNANLSWLIPATGAVGVFWVVSACANYYAGGTLGGDAPILFTTTSGLFSGASLASDVLKTVMLFALTAAVFSRQWRVALVTGAIWVGCTGWSITSATRFVVQNNSEVTDGRGKSADEWVQLKEQIGRLEERRKNVASHRPQSVVEADIASLLRTPGAGDCSVINGPVTQHVCPQVDGLRKELGHAESAQWLDGRLNELRQELKTTPKVTSANPFGDIVGGLFGVSQDEVTTNQALAFAFLLELISGLGLWSVWMAFIGASQKTDANRSAAKAAEDAREATELAKAADPRPDLSRRPVGIHERLTPEQLKLLAEWERKEPAGPLLGKPDPTPEPDGDGTPLTEPESKPDVTEPEPTNVVNLPVQTPPKALSKRDQAKQKKERVKQENRALVESFVVDRLDTYHPDAQIDLTPKGGWKAGGTPGDEIYKEFRRYCKSPCVGKSHFGRFIGEFVDRARNHNGVVYGAVIQNEVRKKKAA